PVAGVAVLRQGEDPPGRDAAWRRAGAGWIGHQALPGLVKAGDVEKDGRPDRDPADRGRRRHTLDRPEEAGAVIPRVQCGDVSAIDVVTGRSRETVPRDQSRVQNPYISDLGKSGPGPWREGTQEQPGGAGHERESAHVCHEPLATAP